MPKTRTERFLNSSIPTTIQILNSDGTIDMSMDGTNVSRASTTLLSPVYDNGYH